VALRAGGNTFTSNQIVTGGNIGLGTTTPNFPLSFTNVLGDKISLWDGGNGTSFGFGITNSQMQIHSDDTNSDIVFGSGSSTHLIETMRIKGNGNVGIGTSTPNFPLSFGSTNGDKLALYDDQLNGLYYGFGITNSGLQIHTDNSLSDVIFGYGSSTNLTETVRIKGNGKIISHMWAATNIFTNTPGPLNLNSSFTSGGGTLVIFASGSGYSSAATASIGMNILVDSTNIGSCKIAYNFTNTHVAFVPRTMVIPGIAAGTHTLALTPIGGATTTDLNDFFNVTVQELPY
jgi:hypothetical protein